MIAGGVLAPLGAARTDGPQGTRAELPPVREAPAPTAFEPWKLVERTEETDEFVASFPSPLPVGDPVNRTVQLRVLVPRAVRGKDVAGPLPVVLVLHYWGARDLRIERSLAAELNARGVAAAIMTLPYHLSRTPPGSRSGDLAIRPDPYLLRETMTQSALDLRRSLDFLRAQRGAGGAPTFDRARIGIAGISLGAIVASLGYALEPSVGTAAFLLGGADLARIVWTSSRLVAPRERLRSLGYTEARLERELAPVEPLTYLKERARLDAPSRTLVIRGAYDTVVPAASSQALVDALPGTQVLEIDTGHYGGIFVQRRLVREMGTFLAGSLGGTDYKVPRQILAPTVRVGLLALAPLASGGGNGGGFDVAAGLDVYRFDKRGRGTASLLLTPRGPQVFLGVQAAEGLRVGFGLGLRRTGFGIFGSVVL